MENITIDNYLDNHYINRSNWLRAAVLGANDGIISVSSLAIGVAAARTNFISDSSWISCRGFIDGSR